MQPRSSSQPRMHLIEGVLLEPVGCLAEFPAEPFQEIAARFFGRNKKASRSGSRAYWHMLNLMDTAGQPIDAAAEALELEAVDQASAYDDVLPALTELKAMGIQLLLASSLSSVAITHFVTK